MSDEFDAVKRKAAYALLDQAIEALTDLCRDEDVTEMPVDAVLLIGLQWIDSDGDRGGAVQICPRGGWQPGYLTAGLLTQAMTIVSGSYCSCGSSGP